MDRWKYFAIGHRDHVLCNPLSEAKLDELIDLLRLSSGGRILDIACGKAELLVRAVRRWEGTGVGVDLSPDFAADARAKLADAGLAGRIEIIEGNGADYDGPAEAFDATACLGASWIWGGHRGTLEALAGWTRPGGRILVGQPFWRREPSTEHLRASGLQATSFGSHRGNVEDGTALGLRFLHSIVSSADDWDRYEGYQWCAVEQYALEKPDDPDVEELLSTMRRNRDSYLRWGREEIGWATYLFLKAATAS